MPSSAAPSPANPPLLLLHGVPLQSYCYRELRPALAAEGIRATAVDWLGAGFSEKPECGAGFSYTEAEFHAALDQLLLALGLDSNSKVQLAVGGFVLGQYGVSWALKNPARVHKLVVFNTPLSPSSKLPLKLAALRAPIFIGEMACQDALIAERFLEGGSRYVLKLEDADVYRKPFLEGSDAVSSGRDDLPPLAASLVSAYFSWGQAYLSLNLLFLSTLPRPPGVRTPGNSETGRAP